MLSTSSDVAAATIVQLRLERQLALLERRVHGPHLLAFERKDFAVLNATIIKTGRLPEDQKIHQPIVVFSRRSV